MSISEKMFLILGVILIVLIIISAPFHTDKDIKETKYGYVYPYGYVDTNNMSPYIATYMSTHGGRFGD